MTRIASTIDVSQPIALQKPVSTVATLQAPVHFTVDQVKDVEVLSQRLTALSQVVAENTKVQRSHPEQGVVTFKNQVCGASGDKLVLTHGFGQFADFVVTRWRSRPLPAAATVSGPSLVSDEEEAAATRQTDKNKLVLRSYVAGVANIRVYAGG